MKTESYTIGDIVRKTPACNKRYPGWKLNEGRILSINLKTVTDDSLATGDRGRYRERYTYQSSYPIFEMLIECLETKRTYQVTQFDFNKD